MDEKTPEQTLLLDQLQFIAQGLAETLAPFCEVVVHDLTNPEHAILALHNNLSGRSIGQPATELGLARLADPNYPQVIANYAGRFADGRAVKSTSIGIKDSTGQYVAAICLNVDLTSFQSLTSVLTSFIRVDPPQRETLDPIGADAVRAQIDAFAARRATSPRALGPQDRRNLLQELRASGHLEVKRSMEIVANHLGLSRAAIYSAAKQMDDRSPT
ncbi:PAS domain-containing protein (plasmid) [Deinococcus sp. KNUC1210]|uniref:helix-turn-helix transcriptional regulator n=1 Tax=Deinococcus sp. KNUC1210 TaxID=2917691 RepID=UPI001EEFB536|nr:PAS domain-containing protein [Deinococcus sp. KNUC1210]ULH18121.1 PAS domain-containing protein [Deinococcus sp. KNUC1210]